MKKTSNPYFASLQKARHLLSVLEINSDVILNVEITSPVQRPLVVSNARVDDVLCVRNENTSFPPAFQSSIAVSLYSPSFFEKHGYVEKIIDTMIPPMSESFTRALQFSFITDDANAPAPRTCYVCDPKLYRIDSSEVHFGFRSDQLRYSLEGFELRDRFGVVAQVADILDNGTRPSCVSSVYKASSFASFFSSLVAIVQAYCGDKFLSIHVKFTE